MQVTFSGGSLAAQDCAEPQSEDVPAGLPAMAENAQTVCRLAAVRIRDPY